MQILLNNIPKEGVKYINDIDFNNQCIGYEISTGVNKITPLTRRYICIPSGYERGISIINDVGVVVMTLGSYKIARQHLNKLSGIHQVYSFKDAKEMWGWMHETP